LKILFSDTTYSYLFPGGKQVHANKLFNELNKLGLDITYENWHDPSLKGDIIHFFGFNDFYKIEALKKKGYKIVYTHILDGLTNLSQSKKLYHKLKNKLINYLPAKFNSLFPWKALNQFDALIYMHESDRKTAIELYGVNPEKTFVIPHAVDNLDYYKNSMSDTKTKYLISTGSIVERKNTVFTASLCKFLQIPIIFIGHPFDEESNYFRDFMTLVDDNIIKYKGYVSEEEKLTLLKGASGFILLSFGESGCISVYEAGAAGLPLLLSDLPWANGYENPVNIQYCSPIDEKKAKITLKTFFENAQKSTTPTFTVHTWKEIAESYAQVYKSLVLQKN
jgi:glycosyltransferase involved in cell wall biosynthesis